MPFVIIVVVLLALTVLPGLWVQSVIRRHRQPADRYSRTGGQTARHLLDSLGLRGVGTEITEQGDHYDPLAKVVRLSPDNFNGRSLTAITIAAHEVGHAMQDARAFAPLRMRTRLVQWLLIDNPVPPGSVLLTGTGLVPPDSFTLLPGHFVEIHVPEIGTLRNVVVEETP